MEPTVQYVAPQSIHIHIKPRHLAEAVFVAVVAAEAAKAATRSFSRILKKFNEEVNNEVI